MATSCTPTRRRATSGTTTGAATHGTTPNSERRSGSGYSYLRTGRVNLFRLAEAHARNTSETDTYHLGPMRGLGSRHNVVKWGDGAKEARISQAAHWRPFYYLTTDERTGDIIRESAEFAGQSIANFDPMREAEPRGPGEPPVRIRIGPDWFALAGNWMAEWERTNDKNWLNLITAGVDSILAMPYGLETGKPEANSKALAATVGFDPNTGKLTAIPNPQTHALVPANYNLATIQGGGEVMFELVPLLGRKEFENAWLQTVPPRHCAARCLGQGPHHAQRGRRRPVRADPGRAALASRPTSTPRPATTPTRRKPSPCCSPRARASPLHTWSPGRTRSARLRKTHACPPTKPRRAVSPPSRSSNSAKTSSPPKPPSAPSANSAPAPLPPPLPLPPLLPLQLPLPLPLFQAGQPYHRTEPTESRPLGNRFATIDTNVAIRDSRPMLHHRMVETQL